MAAGGLRVNADGARPVRFIIGRRGGILRGLGVAVDADRQSELPDAEGIVVGKRGPGVGRRRRLHEHAVEVELRRLEPGFRRRSRDGAFEGLTSLGSLDDPDRGDEPAVVVIAKRRRNADVGRGRRRGRDHIGLIFGAGAEAVPAVIRGCNDGQEGQAFVFEDFHPFFLSFVCCCF